MAKRNLETERENSDEEFYVDTLNPDRDVECGSVWCRYPPLRHLCPDWIRPKRFNLHKDNICIPQVFVTEVGSLFVTAWMYEAGDYILTCLWNICYLHRQPRPLAPALYRLPPTSKHPCRSKVMLNRAHRRTRATHLMMDSNHQPIGS